MDKVIQELLHKAALLSWNSTCLSHECGTAKTTAIGTRNAGTGTGVNDQPLWQSDRGRFNLSMATRSQRCVRICCGRGLVSNPDGGTLPYLAWCASVRSSSICWQGQGGQRYGKKVAMSSARHRLRRWPWMEYSCRSPPLRRWWGQKRLGMTRRSYCFLTGSSWLGSGLSVGVYHFLLMAWMSLAKCLLLISWPKSNNFIGGIDLKDVFSRQLALIQSSCICL